MRLHIVDAALVCILASSVSAWQPGGVGAAPLHTPALLPSRALPVLLHMTQPDESLDGAAEGAAAFPSDAMLTSADLSAASAAATPVLLADPTLPSFSWRTVIFFSLNPVVLLPLPLILYLTLRLDLLGAAFALNKLALWRSALFSAILLAITSLPLEKIPALASFGEVTRASKTICLYAFGASFRPVAAAAAALVLSASAAVCEELAFRGALMGALEKLAAIILPPGWASGAALVLQAKTYTTPTHTHTHTYTLAPTLTPPLRTPNPASNTHP